MEKVNGKWIMRSCACDAPDRLTSLAKLLNLIRRIGFLPLFANAIPGFSVEEHTLADDWWTGDLDTDPWEWRTILAESEETAYGKFFQHKAGFISKEWFPVFANYRRNGYDFDALYDDGLASHHSRKIMDAFLLNDQMVGGRLTIPEIKNKAGETERSIVPLQMQTYLIVDRFQCRQSKSGKSYGLPSGVYCTPESKWGYDFVTAEYHTSPEESWRQISEQVKKEFPSAGEKQIHEVLGIRYPEQPNLKDAKPNGKKSQKVKEPDPMQLPFPENLLTVIGLDLIFDTGAYTPLTEDQMRGLEYAIETLPDKVRTVIKLRYEEHLTTKQAAETIQRSRSRIWEIERKGIRFLKHSSRMSFYKNGYYAELEFHERKTAEELAKRNEPICENGEILWDLAENTKIDKLDLPSKVHFRLVSHGIVNLAQLLRAMEHPDQLLSLRQFGPQSMSAVTEALRKRGLKL